MKQITRSNRFGPGAGRAGFTLVETLVAVVIAGIVLIATYQVLVTTQRVSTVQTEQILIQGSLRAGLDILAQDLREASAAGGDLTVAEPDRVGFRALRAFGVICDVGATVSLVPFGGRITRVAPVYLFVDTDPTRSTDDFWAEAELVDLPVSTSCAGRDAQALVFTGLSGTGPGGEPAALEIGSPVRTFIPLVYHLQGFDGEVFLVRTEADGTTSRLVGPLDPDDGLELVYFDADGNTTTTAAEVRQVRITVRASSGARMTPGRDPVSGALSTTVHLRN